MSDSIPTYTIISHRAIFDHPYVQIFHDVLKQQDHQLDYFYLVSPVEAVATVGLTADGEIILTRQYRHPLGRVIYDLPAGRLNPGEDPLVGARREFEEETGYFPRHIERLGYYNQFPGTLRAATNLFFAKDLQPTQQNLDPGEFLEVVYMPVQAVLDLIVGGDIVDGSLQLGVLLAYHKGLLGGTNCPNDL